MSGSARIAICLATHNPPCELFRSQIESLRQQTHSQWTCFIADDASSLQSRDLIRAETAGDDRFVVVEHSHRLGTYRNFERALLHVDATLTDYIALCDQDDHWYPDKLTTLADALDSTAPMAFSAMHVIHDGAPRADIERYPSTHATLRLAADELMVRNVVPGAAAMFKSSLLPMVLPFPDAGTWAFHDQWIAVVAAINGSIRYVDRPLYDYVQHDANAAGFSDRTRQLRDRRQLWLGRRIKGLLTH